MCMNQSVTYVCELDPMSSTATAVR